MKRGFVRTLPALLTIAIAIPALVACSTPAEECVFPSGDASSVVTAEGKVGSTPKIDMPTPVVTDETQVSTLIEGEGKRLSAGQPALVDVSIVNGATGEVLQDTGYQGGVLLAAASETLPPVTEALECAREGSRLVVVGTAEETHGGQAMPDLGVAEDDSLLFIVDVLDSFLAKADGAARAPGNGDPAVVLAPNGQPGITVPNTEAPDDAVISVLKEGDGQAIEDGDKVVLHYTGVTWADQTVFQTTWETSQPALFELTEGGFTKGFYDGLIDQKVGSQVLLVVPPELGYGDQPNQTIPADSTLIFVVDVLGIAE